MVTGDRRESEEHTNKKSYGFPGARNLIIFLNFAIKNHIFEEIYNKIVQENKINVSFRSKKQTRTFVVHKIDR